MGRNWQERGGSPDRGMIVFGAMLVIVGAVFLAAEVGGLDLAGAGWPLFILVPGLALLALGFSVGGEGGLGAAIPGGIVTTVGLVLAFQNATGAYASWAYMWALVAPGSVGVVLFLYGLLHGRPDQAEDGLRTTGVGAVLFVAFGLFFENFVAIDEGSGSSVLRDALPVLAIVLGIGIVLLNLFAPRPARRGWSGPSAGNQPSDAVASQPQPPNPPAPPAPPAP